LSSFLANGCGNENLIGTNSTKTESYDLVDSITVNVTKMYGGYMFKVNNLTRSTIINDFHVQFDKKIRITEWSLAWQFDPATTDLNNGKIGEKAGTNQQPVHPNESRDVLWIKVQPDGQLNFNWQATRDGVIVQSGKGTLP
jgi:hypothetical protein